MGEKESHKESESKRIREKRMLVKKNKLTGFYVRELFHKEFGSSPFI